jgi:hypothetical protein
MHRPFQLRICRCNRRKGSGTYANIDKCWTWKILVHVLKWKKLEGKVREAGKWYRQRLAMQMDRVNRTKFMVGVRGAAVL